jgi:hypothetical protein
MYISWLFVNGLLSRMFGPEIRERGGGMEVAGCAENRMSFTFMLPCIVIDFFLNNQPDALIIIIFI